MGGALQKKIKNKNSQSQLLVTDATNLCLQWRILARRPPAPVIYDHTENLMLADEVQDEDVKC